jgi:hypothetical protein
MQRRAARARARPLSHGDGDGLQATATAAMRCQRRQTQAAGAQANAAEPAVQRCVRGLRVGLFLGVPAAEVRSVEGGRIRPSSGPALLPLLRLWCAFRPPRPLYS